MLLVVVSGVTVFWVADGISAQASSGRSPGNSGNYRLVQNVFAHGSSPHVLTLQFRGTSITTNTVDWRIVDSPVGVTHASITRVNGQNILSFSGAMPQPSHTFNILAVVNEANRHVASVQLTVMVYNQL